MGHAGGVSITTGSLRVTNGAQLNASTFGMGNGGSVTIIASDTVSFDGQGKNEVFSGAASVVGENAVGNAGGVNITTGSLSITNGTFLTSTSLGKGAAGNIVVEAGSIRLDNQAQISTETIEGVSATTQEQATIKLSTSSLILRRDSRITTNAQGSKLVGGNITIDADVLAALENSDISANSINSFGGRVTINAQAIFGAQSRTSEELQTLLNTDDPTLLDPTNLPSSDITATGADSSLSGTVAINTPDVDRSSGLVELPINLVDATSLVASTCRPYSKEKNRLTLAGRGGLPPNPVEPLSGNATWIDLRTSSASESGRGAAEQRSRRTQENTLAPNTAPQIVEATGIAIASNGKLILTANASTVTPPSLTHPSCYQ